MLPYDLALRYSLKKKSIGVRSGLRGGQFMSPLPRTMLFGYSQQNFAVQAPRNCPASPHNAKICPLENTLQNLFYKNRLI